MTGADNVQSRAILENDCRYQMNSSVEEINEKCYLEL